MNIDNTERFLQGAWYRHGEEITRLIEQGMPYRQIAPKFSISHERVRQLKEKYRLKRRVINKSELSRLSKVDEHLILELEKAGKLKPAIYGRMHYYNPVYVIPQLKALLQRYCLDCDKPISKYGGKLRCSECAHKRDLAWHREHYRRKKEEVSNDG